MTIASAMILGLLLVTTQARAEADGELQARI